MVSYKLLTPEDVYFSGGSGSVEEPLEEPVEEKPVNSPLLEKKTVCSASTSFIALGAFLLVVPPSPASGSASASTVVSAPSREGLACSGVPENWRFDCYPEKVVVTRELCEARNCCFIQVSSGKKPIKDGVPWCFYPPNFPTYWVDALNDTDLGFTAQLKKSEKTYYPKDVETIQLDVLYETDSRLRVKITDPSYPRFEVPISVPNATQKASSPLYTVEFSKKPFGLIVKRTSTGTSISPFPFVSRRINTTVAPVFYADQFLQLSTSLPTRYVYGLGEHRSTFLHDIEWNTLTMWARDVAPMEKTNLYGVHPFYLGMEQGGSAHGVFLLNSNAMDVVLQPAPAITWRTIGGILDIYIFLGPDPSSVIQQYLQVVGSPAMPPYWALGYHLCRWGYNSSDNTWEMVRTMRKYGIPQDVQWNDIDYMDRSMDFTMDPQNFATLPEMVKDLHSHGQKYVMILDPGISSTQQPGTYWPYDDGLKRGIFINDSSGQTLIGKVWPGLTAFPDFSSQETHRWWYDNLQRFHDKVQFDGLWIDMNEPSNFLDGSLKGCPSNDLENPPYTPGVLGGSLRAKTLCASALQKTSVHYNMHSLYGLLEAKASSSALKMILGKRPFVISRSTFPSQGLYSGHWLGDNRSQWTDLYTSISGMLTFNILGIPLIGADICGFGGTTTEEMCVRWTQLGAFYPFTRNHNSINEKAQDPSAFSPSARTAMQEALLLRYSLFPLLYTLFHHAHLEGHTVARPLLFEFPNDEKTYSIDRQFLWGRSLLVTPVLDPGVSYVVGYFPKALWYDFFTGNSLRSQGETVKLQAPLDKINVHLREGAVIPTQRPNTTLWVSSGQPLHLICSLTDEGTAAGDLFWDDGETIDTYETDQYAYIVFHVAKNVMTSQVLHDNVEATFITVETVSFYGVKEEPSNVTVNSQDVPFTYKGNQVLTVTDLGLNLSQNFTISWA
ncbi:lysosomal alpha-glucosidase-like [Scleropages formosus]|uniref:Lysosomal alpha-glucosidase-like n=1 Tax=Scleropages formosus TaxID=113540 RepID=A0A0P7YTL7_SCLFO|nr:lysosomal alpha-glucosidase-like [Scleropages formosus]